MPVTHKINIKKSRFISILIMIPSFIVLFGIASITESDLIPLIVFVLCVCGSVIILENVFHFSDNYNMDTYFFDDHVELVRGSRKNTIYYSQIREVSHLMVINRYHDDKGHYQLTIKTQNRRYYFFSGENYDLHLPFEKTDLFIFYTEFRNRGVKCC